MLEVCELVLGACRQKCRQSNNRGADTDIEFAREKETLFDWLRLSKDVG